MIDTPLEDQLRLYADELDATAPDAGAIVRSNVRSLRPRRTHLWLLSAAAACIVVVALVALGNRDPVAIETGDVVAEPTTEAGPEPTSMPETEGNGAAGQLPASSEPTAPVRRYLLPDPEKWAVVEYWAPDREGGPPPSTSTPPAVWAWKVDGRLVVLLVGPTVAYGPAVPLAEAEISEYGTRSLVGWLSDEGPVGLVGVDMSADELRTIAEQLDDSIDDPILPGAELLDHADGEERSSSGQEQLDFAPIRNGRAELGVRVTATASPRSLASFYTELAEATSLGAVREIQLGELTGYLIAGGTGQLEVSYALVKLDGWVYRWQVQQSPGLVAELLADVTEVEEAQWQAAVASTDQTRADAVSGVIASQEIPTDGLEPPPDLPRYVLPEPWQIEWVTDMGIFTDEERAQRAAFTLAQMGEQPNVMTREQSFEFTEADATPTGIVPNITLFIAEFDAPPDGAPGITEGATPITIAGLDGHASPDARGLGALTSIELGSELVRVHITSEVVSRADLIDFAESLVVRPGGYIEGFDSTDRRFVLLSEGPGEGPVTLDDLLAPATRWTASWTRTGQSGRTVVTVEHMSLDQLGPWLSIRRGQLALSAVEILELDDGATIARADTPGYALRYDSRTESMIAVTSPSGDMTATEILENQLVEIPLDEWIPLVTPHNTPVIGGR